MSANEKNKQMAGTTQEGQGGVTVVGIGAAGGVGLFGIINGLLVAAAWGVVGIGYICVPGSLVAAALGVVCTAMNLSAGFAPMTLCAGVAVACVGLCYPILVGTRTLQGVLLKRDAVAFRAKALGVALAVAVLGAAVAGLAVLLGAGDALSLPAFLQAAFSK